VAEQKERGEGGEGGVRIEKKRKKGVFFMNCQGRGKTRCVQRHDERKRGKEQRANLSKGKKRRERALPFRKRIESPKKEGKKKKNKS